MPSLCVTSDGARPVGEHRFEPTVARFRDHEYLGGGQTTVVRGVSVLLE